MGILEQARAQQDYVVGLRRYFHANPEVSGQEYNTAQRIEAELDGLGIRHSRVGETGVLGHIYGSKPGKGGIIVLRADTDALPITETGSAEYCSCHSGVMHACGHDAHTAMLLGAAKLLHENRAGFAGEVRLVFQQAEEIGAGANLFVQAGALAGAGRVFGMHVANQLPTGMVGVKVGIHNAGVDHFAITITGKATHVSTPQSGADALYIASQIVVLLQGLVTRRISPTEAALVGVGKLNAGDAYNIVAGHAQLEGTTRTITPETRADLRQQITEVAAQTAAMYGGTAHTEWTGYASPLVNNAEVCTEVKQAVRGLGDIQILEDYPLSLGGDDFAEFLLEVPGVYAVLGTGNAAKPATQIPAHNGGFDIDEDALPVGTALFVEYALQWLNEQA